ncbi:MAG: metalloregulator ArsR/SmtB family transcription factor [Actinomycetota bacterium]|nr:metalloregulator ArsR/SmtB family transcription factor [Actinomycetota bacterium]
MSPAAGADADAVLPVLRALAEPKRLAILSALRAKERCVRDLVATESLPQPLVSHHLRVLVDAGLVRARRADGFTMYAVDPEGMAAARRAVGEVLDTELLDPVALPGGNSHCCAG